MAYYLVQFRHSEVFQCNSEEELYSVALRKHPMKDRIDLVMEVSEEDGFKRFQEQTKKLSAPDPNSIPKDY